MSTDRIQIISDTELHIKEDKRNKPLYKGLILAFIVIGIFVAVTLMLTTQLNKGWLSYGIVCLLFFGFIMYFTSYSVYEDKVLQLVEGKELLMNKEKFTIAESTSIYIKIERKNIKNPYRFEDFMEVIPSQYIIGLRQRAPYSIIDHPLLYCDKLDKDAYAQKIADWLGVGIEYPSIYD